MPTHRYKHGVLGDRIEAGAITIRKSDGSLSSFVLTRESVFEDLTPRLADLDRDGRTEVIVVRSYLKHGGTVSVLGLRMDELDLLAELPPIGQPNRWLNPSIIADLDGSGRPVIGLVRTPHIGGQLQIWRFAKGRLEPVLSATGFSNHSIGNRALGLTAVLSSGEERRIIIPDATQANLLVLDAISLSRLASIPLPARPIRDFVVQRDSAGHQWVEIGFEDGITYKLSDPSGRLFD
ncbi:hypothetical protein [uncultured Cohaesibacter sp.]|uniref:hypothetical protein n=1 Tax=uncultured Cohaesibacter sp. TaxID=1002546 RepID=UPI0029C7D8F6|nr:hypothetical protein [uncultured Cohaesibacter sp.]